MRRWSSSLIMMQRVCLLDDHAAAGVLGGVLAADEVVLDEHLLFQRGEILHRLGEGVLHLRQFVDARLDLLEDLRALGLLRPAGEGVVAEVAREAHAAGDDDLMMRAVAAQPVARDVRRTLSIFIGHAGVSRLVRGLELLGSGREIWAADS